MWRRAGRSPDRLADGAAGFGTRSRSHFADRTMVTTILAVTSAARRLSPPARGRWRASVLLDARREPGVQPRVAHTLPPLPERARWFEALDQRGLLRVDDASLAAQHFNWLILSIPLNKAMASRLDQPLFSQRELEHYADSAVRVFLAAYRPPAASP
jgi:hypothetical protein